MKSHDEYRDTAAEGAPFRSPTEWAIWHFSVCLGGGVGARRCVHDDAVNDGDGCPLLGLARQHKTPAEWVGTKGTVIFRCTEKATSTEARASAVAAEKARIEAQHLPLFGAGGVVDGPDV